MGSYDMLKRKDVTMLLLVSIVHSAGACLWDSDTPQDEALGLPEVVAAITGRFERNPPLYYEMRLARVSKHLQMHPEDLAAYDDAGVSCDRLGRGDEAISWMERKYERMLPDSDEDTNHLYRYHANLGTFMIHQWLRRGADRSKIEVVRAARRHIARAIEINPDAHFGREAYQLRAMDWLISPPQEKTEYHPNLLGWRFGDIYGTETEPGEANDAVRALSGLIMLGNAWESVDVFHSLNVALQRDSLGYERGRNGGRNTLAYFAWLRCVELIDAGKRSLYPNSPTGEALKSTLYAPDFVRADLVLDPAFTEMRKDADEWHARRMEFMIKRLEAGRHPDTDPDFWTGYVESPAPKLPAISVPQAFSEHQMRKVVLFVVAVCLMALVPVVMIWSRFRRSRIGSNASTP